MNSKTVYSFDPVTNALVGPTQAFESPLEPGVFHLPANSTDIEPPSDVDSNYEAYFSGDVWKVRPKPKDAVDNDVKIKEDNANMARFQRNALLAASDWTQLTDSPLSPKKQKEWSDYRKALRDVPNQKGFPDNITWPEAPK